MNKAELVEAIAEGSDISKASATRALDTVIETITTTLSGGDSVVISGLGTFTVKDRAARKGRNPQTGEEIQIKAARVPGFKSAKALKDAVNNK